MTDTSLPLDPREFEAMDRFVQGVDPVPSTSQISPPPPVPLPTSKRTNPLTDLIETERTYVDNLALIIKKVAAAWSRNNFPPQQLDTLFRAIEAVYRSNKNLLARLEEIGPSPSSPKALGDLLMRWVSYRDLRCYPISKV